MDTMKTIKKFEKVNAMDSQNIFKTNLEKQEKLTKYLSSNPKIPVEWVKHLQTGSDPCLREIFIWNGKSSFGFAVFPIRIYNNVWTHDKNKLTYVGCGGGGDFVWSSAFKLFDIYYNKKSKKELSKKYGKNFDSVLKDIKHTTEKLRSEKGTITYKELLNYQIFINLCRKKELKEYAKNEKQKKDVKVAKEENEKMFEDIFGMEK